MHRPQEMRKREGVTLAVSSLSLAVVGYDGQLAI